MTDLQKMVLVAIAGEGTPEQKTRAALDAVRFWYLIDAQNPYAEGAEL